MVSRPSFAQLCSKLLLLRKHDDRLLHPEAVLEEARCFVDREALCPVSVTVPIVMRDEVRTCLRLAEVHENIAQADETEVQAVRARGAKRFELGEIGHRHDQVSDPAL
jgi:hypothetical protein